MSIAIYLAAGFLAGMLAGLFGVGGGAVIVPMLIFIFGVLNFAPDIVVHTALGTSFATIILTSLSSVSAHHRLGNVDWQLVRRMLPGLVLGVVLGSIIAVDQRGSTLQLAIGAFLCCVGLQMFFRLQPSAAFRLPGGLGLFGAGGLIGVVSAFFGIAGGSMTVPFLSACQEPMKRAVASSAACGLPIAIFGALVYALKGLSVDALPSGSTGYIYWPAFLGIAIVSMPSASLGAKLASRASERVLKMSFGLVMVLIGVRLLVTA